MNPNNNKIKYFIIALWLIFFSASLYIYFFKGDALKNQFSDVFSSSLILGYIVYLTASCLRGFTLIPVTYFIVLGIILLPPLPLYIFTIIGVMVSSVCVYYFSEYLGFDKYFETRYKRRVKEAKEILSKNELIIVAGWSFMPFLPTDLICYVCGTLKMDIKKFMLGVFIGEGISCAVYIFLGKAILNSL